MQSKIDRAIYLEKCRKNGCDSYPNARIDYPDANDNEACRTWDDAWIAASKEFGDIKKGGIVTAIKSYQNERDGA